MKMGNAYDNDSITVHDRLVRAWENSMELTRDFEMYSKRLPQGEMSDMFKEFAEDEARHASKLRSVLEREQSEGK
jgi:rubrerythrin